MVTEAQKRAHDKWTESNGYYKYGRGAWATLRKRAADRWIDFEITEESLKTFWLGCPDECYYCGITVPEYIRVRDFILSYDGELAGIGKFKRFYRSPRHAKIKSMTIDRMENYLGYVDGNLCKACWICNSLKSDFFEPGMMVKISQEIMGRLAEEIEKEVPDFFSGQSGTS